MDIDLTDKVVMVTGAGLGLGRALALGLAGSQVEVFPSQAEQLATSGAGDEG